jgi:sodium/proline symporter
MRSNRVQTVAWAEIEIQFSAFFRHFPFQFPSKPADALFMPNYGLDMSLVVFAATLLGTFLVAFLGRRHSNHLPSAALSEQRLNRWLVGLSAGATANSGFVVTAAVGLGYSFGTQWLLLPVSWLLGDLLFWFFFPQRINGVGRKLRATTMTDVIVDRMKPQFRLGLKRAVAVLVMICLGGYVSAQWIAGQKFLRGAFGFDGTISLLAFAAIIIGYTAIGGFRGSVYVDSMQAIIRLIGTVTAVVAVLIVASRDSGAFWHKLDAAGPDFLRLFPHGSMLSALPFIVGFAAAALGFGLGQPQMVTRYLAGATPEETRSAWWIYNFFVQFTWISMTGFGIILRGVMSAIPDPEMGLSLFFRSYTGAILTGLITADIFATIAATSNSLLVATAQTAARDLLGAAQKTRAEELWHVTAVIGAATMILSLGIHSTVFSLALSSVSLLGAALAPPMLIRLLKWHRTDMSAVATIIVGFGTAVLWRGFGLSGFMNEAAPGIALALSANFVLTRLSRRRDRCFAYDNTRFQDE